jgi:hypothetical protein
VAAEARGNLSGSATAEERIEHDWTASSSTAGLPTTILAGRPG